MREWFSMGPKGLTFPRLSLSNCERDRSDEPVRILYSAEPSVGSKRAIGCSNILSFGKPLEGLKAGNRRSNNRTIYVRMRLTIYLLFNYLTLLLTIILTSCWSIWVRNGFKRVLGMQHHMEFHFLANSMCMYISQIVHLLKT